MNDLDLWPTFLWLFVFANLSHWWFKGAPLFNWWWLVVVVAAEVLLRMIAISLLRATAQAKKTQQQKW
jgi:hypothetical protein